MCDFKPGDEVVCVRSAVFYKDGRDAPTELCEGQKYTVKNVGLYDGGIIELRSTVSVYLVEAKNVCPGAGRDVGFYYDRFRKIQKRNSSLTFESFLTIRPGFEEPRRVTTPAKEKA